jgi:hypothetical protein
MPTVAALRKNTYWISLGLDNMFHFIQTVSRVLWPKNPLGQVQTITMSSKPIQMMKALVFRGAGEPRLEDFANTGVHGMPVQLNLDKAWSHNVSRKTGGVDTSSTSML